VGIKANEMTSVASRIWRER